MTPECNRQEYTPGKVTEISESGSVRSNEDINVLEEQELIQEKSRAIRYGNNIREGLENQGFQSESIEKVVSQTFLLISRDIDGSIWRSVAHNVTINSEQILLTAGHIISGSHTALSRYYSSEIIHVIGLDGKKHTIDSTYLDHEVDIGFIRTENESNNSYNIGKDIPKKSHLGELFLLSLNSSGVEIISESSGNLGFWENIMSKTHGENSNYINLPHNSSAGSSGGIIFNRDLSPNGIVSGGDRFESFTRAVNMTGVLSAYDRFIELEGSDCTIN